jgi:peptidoglycan hydrolase-like protein with peptidoglycan-binding domain
MYDSRFRRVAADDNQIPPSSGVLANPDRVALWAVVLAVVAMIAGAASAHAESSGGIGGSAGGSGGWTADDNGSGTPGCPDKEFGRRTLEVGDCGDDVATLNWLLKSENTGRAPLVDQFQSPTAKAVRAFQQRAAIQATGVVDARTSTALVEGMQSQVATWYGPGFFGNETACGETLRRSTVGVAHRTLPCGTKVVLRYKGRYLRTTVIDRGPFSNGAKWDLTQAAARQLRFDYTDDVAVAKLGR